MPHQRLLRTGNLPSFSVIFLSGRLLFVKFFHYDRNQEENMKFEEPSGFPMVKTISKKKHILIQQRMNNSPETIFGKNHAGITEKSLVVASGSTQNAAADDDIHC